MSDCQCTSYQCSCNIATSYLTTQLSLPKRTGQLRHVSRHPSLVVLRSIIGEASPRSSKIDVICMSQRRRSSQVLPVLLHNSCYSENLWKPQTPFEGLSVRADLNELLDCRPVAANYSSRSDTHNLWRRSNTKYETYDTKYIYNNYDKNKKQ